MWLKELILNYYIKDFDDDEAIICMVDSNKISPFEKELSQFFLVIFLEEINDILIILFLDN